MLSNLEHVCCQYIYLDDGGISWVKTISVLLLSGALAIVPCHVITGFIVVVFFQLLPT